MEPHPLEELVQDLTELIAHTGIRLEFIANHYLAVRRGEPLGTQYPGTNIEAYDKGRGYSSFTSARENESRHEEEQIKRSAFTYYLKQYQERIEKQFPHYTHNQVITKAAAEFKTLPQVQKIQYLRLFINDSKQQGLQNNQGRQLPDFLDPQQRFDQFSDLRHEQSVTNGYVSSRYLSPFRKETVLDQQKEHVRGYTLPLNGYGLDGKTGAKRMGDEFKMQNIEESGSGRGAIGLQGGADREEKDEGRGKNDIYKIALGHKSSERQERIQPKGQENKEKSEFPTLKSLFKKLQNTS